MANIHNDKSRFQWPVIIANQQSRSSLDYYYGPYESLSDLDDLPVNLKTVGFTVAVVDESKQNPVEYWWTGSSWERKTVDVSSVVCLKGVVESESALSAMTGQSNGDMYLVPNGDDEYREFVWMADKGTWELLGLRSATLNQGLTITNAAKALTVGSSKDQSGGTYNGSQAVTLDMSKFVTADKAASTYTTMASVKSAMADLYVPLTKVKTWVFKNGSNKVYYGNKFATVNLNDAGQRATLFISGKDYWNATDAGATWVFQVSQNYTSSDGQIIGAVGVQLHGTAVKNGDLGGTSPSATITRSKCYLLAKWTSTSTYDLYWIVPGGANYYNFCATFICASGYTVTPVSGETGVLTSTSAIPTVDNLAKGVLRPRIINLATTGELSSYATIDSLSSYVTTAALETKLADYEPGNINDGKLTIKTPSGDKTFTANSSSDVTVDLSTKVQDGKLTITKPDGTSVTFTANQSTAASLDLSGVATTTALEAKIKELQDQITALQTTVSGLGSVSGLQTYMENKLKQLEGIVKRNTDGTLTTVTGYAAGNFDGLTETSLNVKVTTDGDITATTFNGATLNLTGYGYANGEA